MKAIRLGIFLNPNPVYGSCVTRKNLHELHGIKAESYSSAVGRTPIQYESLQIKTVQAIVFFIF